MKVSCPAESNTAHCFKRQSEQICVENVSGLKVFGSCHQGYGSKNFASNDVQTHPEMSCIQHAASRGRHLSEKFLPKPIINVFEGDPTDYWAFINHFTCHIADWLPAKIKLSYLLQHCSSNVCQHIQHFTDIHEGRSAYDMVWQELKQRYEQPYIIAQTCEDRMLKFPKIDRDIADGLNKLTVLMKRSCYALADVNIAYNLDSIQFLASLANKFPMDIKRKWVEASLRITEELGQLLTI